MLNFWYKNIKQQKLNRPKQQQQLSRVFVGYVYAIKKVWFSKKKMLKCYATTSYLSTSSYINKCKNSK